MLEADPQKRKRRWYQFSLRTLMILVALLAVACCYVAREYRTVQERFNYLENASIIVDPDGTASIPLVRRLLGDQSIGEIGLPVDFGKEKCQRGAALFPEARVGLIKIKHVKSGQDITEVEPFPVDWNSR
jgi:hypothetical protein